MKSVAIHYEDEFACRKVKALLELCSKINEALPKRKRIEVVREKYQCSLVSSI